MKVTTGTLGEATARLVWVEPSLEGLAVLPVPCSIGIKSSDLLSDLMLVQCRPFLVHDHAWPHVTKVCRQFLDDDDDAIDWPSRHPDLSPVENLWDFMQPWPWNVYDWSFHFFLSHFVHITLCKECNWRAWILCALTSKTVWFKCFFWAVYTLNNHYLQTSGQALISKLSILQFELNYFYMKSLNLVLTVFRNTFQKCNCWERN